jgi:hypothetical protein
MGREDGMDLRKQAWIDWIGKAALSGLVGGAVMATYLTVVMGLTGRGFFTPINLVAATLPPFRPVISGFLPMAAVSGLLGHAAISALWGIALGFVSRRLFPNLFRGAWSQVSAGLALGFFAWAVTGLRIGPDIDPALRMLPASHAFIAHLCFGLATATVLWAWAGTADRSKAPETEPLDHGDGLGFPVP